MLHNLRDGHGLSDGLAQGAEHHLILLLLVENLKNLVDELTSIDGAVDTDDAIWNWFPLCLLYTSPSPRDRTRSRMPSSA